MKTTRLSAPRAHRCWLPPEALEARIAPATVFAVDTANNLYTFDSSSPTAATQVGAGPITGLQTGEEIEGIDFRPATLELYALGSTGRLYTIDPATAAATEVAPLTVDPTDTTSPFMGLSGTDFGVDFNPVPDRLRVVSNTEQNLRINPDTGATFTDTNLTYNAMDPGNVLGPDIVGAAYTNSFRGATTTLLYGIDAQNNTLVTINPPNNGTLNTVGALGVDTGNLVGFDIQTTGDGNFAFASLTPAVGTPSGFYAINLTTGQAALIGQIGGGMGLSIRDIALSFTANDEVTIAANGRAATFTDVDGDQVTVRVSKGSLERGDFTVLEQGAGLQILSLNLNDDGDEFEGAAISIASKRGPLGDGFVNVGYINSTGFDLGAVGVDGDLGQIDAGNSASLTSPGLVSLTAQSLGRFGAATQGSPTPGVMTNLLQSDIVGGLGKVTIARDAIGAAISVGVGTSLTADPSLGTIGRVQIGGDLVGGTLAGSGSIQSTGAIGKIIIRGDLIGDSGAFSGAIVTSNNASIGNVNIGGDVIGGSTGTTGIFSDARLGSVKIGGDLRGASVATAPKISAEGITGDTPVSQALAIRSVAILGRIEFAEILAGFSTAGAATNPDVQIGKINVRGDWVASSVSAGIARGADGFFGNADAGEGPVAPAIPADNDADVTSRIAGITIRGQALGTPGATGDHFGFVAQEIAAFSVGGSRFKVTVGPGNDNFPVGSTGDLRLRESATATT